MTPEDIGRILDEIGERIGPAGAYVWQFTVRQIYLESIGWLFWAGLFLILSLLGLYKVVQSVRRREEDWHFVVIMFLGFACVCLSYIVTSSVVTLLNPEYHALMRLLERLIPQ